MVIIAFHDAAQAVLQLNGEISPTHIPLNRGLKQGSMLSPILFNIFFGVLTGEFEKTVYVAHIIGHNIRRQGAVQP